MHSIDHGHSDTVATTLLCIFYRLAQNPRYLREIQNELAAIDSIENLNALRKLPCLNGVIEETLRLHPAVPTGGLRQTPPEGAMVSGRFIPGNTVICAPRYSISRCTCPFPCESLQDRTKRGMLKWSPASNKLAPSSQSAGTANRKWSRLRELSLRSHSVHNPSFSPYSPSSTSSLLPSHYSSPQSLSPYICSFPSLHKDELS